MEPTPEAKKLGYALKKRGVPITWKSFEKWDGYKSIDIAIPKSRINIEVDGAQHHFDKKQALADLRRMYHSFKKGYITLRISNELVRDDSILDETADCIVDFLNESNDQLDEGEDTEESF